MDNARTIRVVFLFKVRKALHIILEVFEIVTRVLIIVVFMNTQLGGIDNLIVVLLYIFNIWQETVQLRLHLLIILFLYPYHFLVELLVNGCF